MRQPGHRVRVRLGYEVQYPDPLRVRAGDPVSVGREDPEFPGWKWCKGPDGREGWVPVELLSNEGPDAVVLQDYSARELAVEPKELVVVKTLAITGCWCVTHEENEAGFLPPIQNRRI